MGKKPDARNYKKWGYGGIGRRYRLNLLFY